MTVKELIDKLKTLDEDKEIGLDDLCYGGANRIHDITLVDDTYVID